MDPKHSLGLGLPAPGLTDPRGDARPNDDRPIEMTEEEMLYLFREAVGIQDSEDMDMIKPRSAYPSERHDHSRETFNATSTFAVVGKTPNAPSTTSIDFTTGRPAKIRRLSNTSNNPNIIKDSNFIEPSNITHPSDNSPQPRIPTLCTSCRKQKRSPPHGHRLSGIPSPVNSTSRGIQQPQHSIRARPELVALAPKPAPNVSLPYPPTNSVAAPSQGIPNARPIPSMTNNMNPSVTDNGNPFSTAPPIHSMTNYVGQYATANAMPLAPPISSMGYNMGQYATVNAMPPASPIPSMPLSYNMGQYATANAMPLATPIPSMANNVGQYAPVNPIPNMSYNMGQYAPVNPIPPAPPGPQAATTWPRCRGSTRKKVHYPCKHSPARLAWKRTATQCIDCLANAPKGEVKTSVEARVAAGLNPCSKCYVRDARPDGGLCQNCLTMGRANLALRNAGNGKRKHANMN